VKLFINYQPLNHNKMYISHTKGCVQISTFPNDGGGAGIGCCGGGNKFWSSVADPACTLAKRKFCIF
jgi:hypothetical protein